jgi:Arc/MetJ-type ribon-helix-helix transcriptional regulator
MLNMGNRYTFTLDNEDLEDWMEKMHEEGDFYNRSHVIEQALKELRKKSDADEFI